MPTLLTRDRVEVLGLDAIGTIFEWQETRDVLTSQYLCLHCKRYLHPAAIAARTLELRRMWPRGSMDMDTYWIDVINTKLFEEAGVRRNIRERIRKYRQWLFSTPEHFIVRNDMRRFIEMLARRPDVVLVIMSNHDRNTIVRLLKAFDLYQYFPHSHILASKQVGHTKPSREYAQAVRKILGLRSCSQMALIGNSLENDGEMVKHGSPVFIIDRTGSLPRLLATLPAGITPGRKTSEAQQWTTDVCQLAYPAPEPMVDDPSNGNCVHVNGRIIARTKIAS